MKINFNWVGKKEKPVKTSKPEQGRFSKASDAVLDVAGKVTWLLVLVAASVISVEKTKNSYKNL